MKHSDRRGMTILLITFLMMSTMAVATIIAAELVRTGIRLGKTQANSTTAYFAAEAGSERVLYGFFKGSLDIPTLCGNTTGRCLFFNANCAITGCGVCTSVNATCALSNGTRYKVIYAPPVPPATMSLQVIGYHNDGVTQRIVQVDL